MKTPTDVSVSMIDEAITRVNAFRGGSLTLTIADLETKLRNQRAAGVVDRNRRGHIDRDLLLAIAAVKRASAQIDVVLHAAGILYALPYLLEEGEIVESLSLGAANAGSDFDLVTDRRIAEFKFIQWQGGAEAVRKKTLFGDYFRLARHQTHKKKYLYLLNTAIPLRFLQGNSVISRILDRNARLFGDFEQRFGGRFHTVGEFYAAHKDSIQIVNLTEAIPEFGPLATLALAAGLPE